MNFALLQTASRKHLSVHLSLIEVHSIPNSDAERSLVRMLAKLGVLALLLVSPLVKATFPSSEQLEAAFDASTSPCKDLYRHVCSYDNEVIRQFVEEAEWGLMKQLAEFAVDDPVYKAYVESFLKGIRRPVLGPAPKDEEGFGKHLGRIYASGGCTSQDCSKKISFICNATTNEFEFLDLGTEFRSGTIDAVENRFVKGFVLGYLATLGFSSDKIENFMVNYGDDLKKPEGVEGNGFLAEYGLRAKYLYEHWWMEQERHVKETSLSCKSQECKKLHAKNIIRLAREPVFAPYFNVLFAKLFYERPKQTKPENIVEMENLVAKIKGRIVNSFDNATYLEAGEKEKVVKYLKNLDVVIGIPMNLRNHEELATLLQEFQEFVLEGFSSSESGALGKIINRISIFRNRRAAYNKNLFQPANKGKPSKAPFSARVLVMVKAMLTSTPDISTL
ncbi:hypothetical protein L596_023514 [Steinernema carpocapsae]|uniref:Peptidase M13 N-terminal domain-containing protein n=1 Tax=Steinernema carpocapsae TaxID=34508 RepID=A0A4U5MDW1_STECR|nr:hypothetical protein L596_023514 [Steinernema carpocapsae]